MQTEKLRFVEASNVQDPRIRSLILTVKKSDGTDLASLFCVDKDWILTIVDDTGIVNIAWDDFIEVFHRFLQFMSRNNKANLIECEEMSQSSDESSE